MVADCCIYVVVFNKNPVGVRRTLLFLIGVLWLDRLGIPFVSRHELNRLLMVERKSVAHRLYFFQLIIAIDPFRSIVYVLDELGKARVESEIRVSKHYEIIG